MFLVFDGSLLALQSQVRNEPSQAAGHIGRVWIMGRSTSAASLNPADAAGHIGEPRQSAAWWPPPSTNPRSSRSQPCWTSGRLIEFHIHRGHLGRSSTEIRDPRDHPSRQAHRVWQGRSAITTGSRRSCWPIRFSGSAEPIAGGSSTPVLLPRGPSH